VPLTLHWNGSTTLPVEGESLRPETFVGISADSIAHQTILVGNAKAAFGELFTISGTVDGSLILEGDLTHIRRIGRGMKSGSITIHGDCGGGLGQGMLGGEILVEGSVGPSACMGMRGGLVRIRGSAGDNLGGSEPGARLGMRDGVILVDGNIGPDAGLAMRRGLIAVQGNVGDGLGRGMVAGSIFAFADVGSGMGRGMKRGSIVLFGNSTPQLGPGFWPSGRDRPTFLTIALSKLRALGFPVPGSAFVGLCSRYNGDRAEGGQGEVLVADSA
jgi:formylmethanofuran dehydrogenase subunit C